MKLTSYIIYFVKCVVKVEIFNFNMKELAVLEKEKWVVFFLFHDFKDLDRKSDV
jgi:hypothetical protein